MNEYIEEMLNDNECILADGFNKAIIGISQGLQPKAIYNMQKCIHILMERDSMNIDEAEEFFDFNVLGGLNENSPIFIIQNEDLI